MSTHSLEFSFTAETFNLAGETITAAPVAEVISKPVAARPFTPCFVTYSDGSIVVCSHETVAKYKAIYGEPTFKVSPLDTPVTIACHVITITEDVEAGAFPFASTVRSIATGRVVAGGWHSDPHEAFESAKTTATA